MITAVCCRSNEGSSNSSGATFEDLGDGNVEGCDDGPCDSCLGLIRGLLGHVNGFCIARVTSV